MTTLRFRTFFLLLLAICFIGSCSKKDYRSNYQVRIQYLDKDSTYSKDLRNGIIGLDFLKGFSDDSLTLNVDGRLLLRDVISTNEITGNALTVKIDSLKHIKELSIRINSGKYASIKCDSCNQLFLITFNQDTLKISGTTFFPSNQ